MSFFIPVLTVVSGEATTVLPAGFVRVTLEFTTTVYSCPDIRPLDTVYWFTFFSSGPDEVDELPKNLQSTS